MKAIYTVIAVIVLAIPPSQAKHGSGGTQDNVAPSTQKAQESNHDANNGTPAVSVTVNNSLPAPNVQDAKQESTEDTDIQRRLVSYTFWLVIVGIVTSAFIWWQASETRRSVQAIRDSIPHQERAANAAAQNIDLYINKERARVRIQMKELTLPSADDSEYDTVDFTVNAYGQTDAFVTESLCVSYMFPTGIIDDPDLGDRVMFPIVQLPAVIRANTPVECCALLGKRTNKLMVDEIKAKRMATGVRGFIMYRDVFEQKRETHFRYKWEYSEAVEDYGQWVKSGRPEENRET